MLKSTEKYSSQNQVRLVCSSSESNDAHGEKSEKLLDPVLLRGYVSLCLTDQLKLFIFKLNLPSIASSCIRQLRLLL